MDKSTVTTPFSLALLASTVLRPFLFRYPLQKIANTLVAIVLKRHPNILERLEDFTEKKILVIPTDMAFCMLFHIEKDSLSVQVLKNGDETTDQADATIRSSLASLLQLLEGKMDGDALFFSRELSIEGNTEIIVAIRNAFDSENIDLAANILSFLGPFAKPTHLVGKHIESTLLTVMADIDKIRQAWTEPLQKRCDTMGSQVSQLTERMDSLEKEVNRTKRHRIAVSETDS